MRQDVPVYETARKVRDLLSERLYARQPRWLGENNIFAQYIELMISQIIGSMQTTFRLGWHPTWTSIADEAVLLADSLMEEGPR